MRVSLALTLPPLTVKARDRLELALNECEVWGGDTPGIVVNNIW
jgi:hypothetical protein